ncbi:hypothetical protein PR048_027453 [Dryococelus australis]|uniref:Uncharacterized protein n=1 Tax=Dryococelus australis TaxID=614101 RepID=A0ABQ9GFI1_9NEOP|nr:hypothetical protein PR048_027453 [Dryococelus australis]
MHCLEIELEVQLSKLHSSGFESRTGSSTFKCLARTSNRKCVTSDVHNLRCANLGRISHCVIRWRLGSTVRSQLGLRRRRTRLTEQEVLIQYGGVEFFESVVGVHSQEPVRLTIWRTRLTEHEVLQDGRRPRSCTVRQSPRGNLLANRSSASGKPFATRGSQSDTRPMSQRLRSQSENGYSHFKGIATQSRLCVLIYSVTKDNGFVWAVQVRMASEHRVSNSAEAKSQHISRNPATRARKMAKNRHQCAWQAFANQFPESNTGCKGRFEISVQPISDRQKVLLDVSLQSQACVTKAVSGFSRNAYLCVPVPGSDIIMYTIAINASSGRLFILNYDRHSGPQYIGHSVLYLFRDYLAVGQWSGEPLVHTLFNTSWRTLAQSSSSTVTADNQSTVYIGTFVRMTVEFRLQVIELANFSKAVRERQQEPDLVLYRHSRYFALYCDEMTWPQSVLCDVVMTCLRENEIRSQCAVKLGSQPSIASISHPSVSQPSVDFFVRQLKATHDGLSSIDPSGQKMFSVTTHYHALIDERRRHDILFVRVAILLACVAWVGGTSNCIAFVFLIQNHFREREILIVTRIARLPTDHGRVLYSESPGVQYLICGKLIRKPCVLLPYGSEVTERLDCSPPTNAKGVQFQAGSLPDCGKWESCPAGLLGDLPFSSPLQSGDAPFSPHYILIGSQDLVVKSPCMAACMDGSVEDPTDSWPFSWAFSSLVVGNDRWKVLYKVEILANQREGEEGNPLADGCRRRSARRVVAMATGTRVVRRVAAAMPWPASGATPRRSLRLHINTRRRGGHVRAVPCRHAPSAQFRSAQKPVTYIHYCKNTDLLVSVLELAIVLLVLTTPDTSLYLTAFITGRSSTNDRPNQVSFICAIAPKSKALNLSAVFSWCAFLWNYKRIHCHFIGTKFVARFNYYVTTETLHALRVGAMRHLGVRVSVALIAPSLLDLGRGVVEPRWCSSSDDSPSTEGTGFGFPDEVAPRFSHVGNVPGDDAVRRVFSGISRFPRPYIPALRRTLFASPSSALQTSMLRAAQIGFYHWPRLYIWHSSTVQDEVPRAFYYRLCVSQLTSVEPGKLFALSSLQTRRENGSFSPHGTCRKDDCASGGDEAPWDARGGVGGGDSSPLTPFHTLLGKGGGLLMKGRFCRQRVEDGVRGRLMSFGRVPLAGRAGSGSAKACRSVWRQLRVCRQRWGLRSYAGGEGEHRLICAVPTSRAPALEWRILFKRKGESVEKYVNKLVLHCLPCTLTVAEDASRSTPSLVYGTHVSFSTRRWASRRDLFPPALSAVAKPCQVHATRREQRTPVQSPARNGDSALHVFLCVALIARVEIFSYAEFSLKKTRFVRNLSRIMANKLTANMVVQVRRLLKASHLFFAKRIYAEARLRISYVHTCDLPSTVGRLFLCEACLLHGEMSMEYRRNESTGEAGEPREREKKTRWPAASSSTIPTSENPEQPDRSVTVAPIYVYEDCVFFSRRRGSARVDRDTRTNHLIASTSKALNWRAELPSITRLWETFSVDPSIL